MKEEFLHIRKEIADLNFTLGNILKGIYKQNLELVKQIKELKTKLKEKK